MENFKSVSHAMELGEGGGRGGYISGVSFQTAKVIDMKLGSHNVHHVKNVLGMS